MDTAPPRKAPHKSVSARAVKAVAPAPANGAVTTAKVAHATRPAAAKGVAAAAKMARKPASAADKAPAPKADVAKAPAARPKVVPETKEKVKKAKLVRDSFTMPESEYAALGEVKKACLKAGFEVKKSELLRIGVAIIRTLELPALQRAIGALAPLKPGRPRKEK